MFTPTDFQHLTLHPKTPINHILGNRSTKKQENTCIFKNKAVTLHPQTQPSPGGGMVDALVSGASVERRAGSSPVLGTIKAT